MTPFYAPAPRFGGMPRAVAGLCGALARRGVETAVATPRLEPADAGDAEDAGVRVHRFPSWLHDHLVPWCPALPRWLERELGGFDVVHLHGHRSGVALSAARAARRARRPLVLQTHGTFPAHGRHRAAKWVYEAAAGRRIVREASALVAVSAAEARDLPRPARVVPNGVAAVGAGGPAAPRRGGLLFVGNASPQKRLATLADVLRAIPSATLDVVGPADAAAAGFRDLGGRVRFRGVLEGDGLAAAYAGADLLVHPARDEAFGLAAFEAALHGTAAVVAAGHGAGEWYAAAGGCVVGPDAEALAAAVRERLADRALREAEAARVAAYARAHLTWDAAAEAVHRLYLELVA